MTARPLDLVLLSTPIGGLGTGRGGGVELTLTSLLRGLVERGHRLRLVAAMGSVLPPGCEGVELLTADGEDQPSWQHLEGRSPVVIPRAGLLPRLLELALAAGAHADAVVNFGYDWLPLWITPHVTPRLFHLISMGSVAEVMRDAIEALALWDQRRLAFHTSRQAADFALPRPALVVGNGFDLSRYQFRSESGGPLGWAGRVAPEKGLEDAAAAAAALGERLRVWGLREDSAYAEAVEAAVPPGTIEWRGFLPTAELQRELGACRALINTPKWNEAYGNVVVEALACGVPVVAYDRGGPGELVVSGETGFLVQPDAIEAMTTALRRVPEIDRHACRAWVETHATQAVFASRVETWIQEGLDL
ncbi:MAG: glycosyltransferase [Cyanobacteriota bacterium]|nr:glycosyltransferase [Cyanobacteriota bacterium]